jgi:hypothetical protein
VPYRAVRAGNKTDRTCTCLCTAEQRFDGVITGGSLIGATARSSAAETSVCVRARVC